MLKGSFSAGSLLAAAVALTASMAGGPAYAQAGRFATPAEFSMKPLIEACQSADDIAFQRAIEAITTVALERGLAGLDSGGIVGDEWRRGGLDRIIAKEVDLAIEAVKDESSLGKLLGSIVNPETARALATPVAERVFRSDAIKAAMDQLAASVGREIGKRIEASLGEIADPAARCIESYIGPRYGLTIAKVVAATTARDLAIDPAKGQATVSSGAVLAEGSGAIAGVVMVVARRQIALISNRIAQRLVGVALGRVVSTVVSGVGVVLIAKDIWDFRHGVLPIIAEEMKASSTRTAVQQELAKTINEQLAEHARDIGGKTSERIVEIWHEFRRAHAKVVELSERDADFRRLVDSISPARLPRLNEAVALVLATEGEGAIPKRLGDGTLHRAVERLPAHGFEIARELGSLDLGLKWDAVAGDLLQRVAEDQLHRRNGPDAFTRASLTRLLGLNDRLAATRLAAIEPRARDVLFELPDVEVRQIARALPESELQSLAGYLGALDASQSKMLLSAIVARPQRMTVLASVSVRDAVLASRDRTAALRTMLRGEGYLDVAHLAEDVRLAYGGVIDPRLLLARHPGASGVAAFGGLLTFMLLWRMLFGRRPRRETITGTGA